MEHTKKYIVRFVDKEAKECFFSTSDLRTAVSVASYSPYAGESAEMWECKAKEYPLPDGSTNVMLEAGESCRLLSADNNNPLDRVVICGGTFGLRVQQMLIRIKKGD